MHQSINPGNQFYWVARSGSLNETWAMVTTPRPIIDSVVRSVCDRGVERLVPLAGGGMNETYRAEFAGEPDTQSVR